MITNESTIAVLNQLIRVNHERIAGYEKAIPHLGALDPEIRSIFCRMQSESQQHIAELVNEINLIGGATPIDSSVSGKIFMLWRDVDSDFAETDRDRVLDNCETGEDSAHDAYEAALQSDAEFTIAQLNLITRQKAAIQLCHNLVRTYREVHDLQRLMSDPSFIRQQENSA